MSLLRITAASLLTVWMLASAGAASQLAPGTVRGEVTDSSGGVLPGVTVVATASNGRAIATAVTDGSGSYVLRGLPAGPVTLTFQLEGFAGASMALTIRPGAELRAVERLELSSISETVVVHAPPPAIVVPPPARIVQAPPPPPVVTPVPAHDRDSICGPSKPGALPESLGTINARRDGGQGGLYTTGAQVAIAGGVPDGLVVGRNVVARRYFHVRGPGSTDVIAEHSAGLLQIVAAGERSSLAVVVYACDELKNGDFLAAFAPEPVRDPDPLGTPVFTDAARILFADDGETLGAPRRLMVIDQGTGRGTRVGQRFTLFRRGVRPGSRDVVGDAIVVAVRRDSATIRIDHVTDAITPGDWAAPQSLQYVTRTR